MADVTQAWLKANVGEPSEKWGSKYSEIYKVAGEVERQLAAGKKNKETISKLYKLINAWSASAHSGAKTPADIAEKDRQQRQMNLFRARLQLAYLDENENFQEQVLIGLSQADATYAKELALVRGVCAKMAQSSNQLVRNTGAGLADVEIVLVLRDGENGCWLQGKGVMNVNPVLAYNHSLLTGLLVHEYHHKLNRSGHDHLYLDEFVAHMKQFSITYPAKSEQEMVDLVNGRLKLLYPGHVERWTKIMRMQLVKRFDDLGDFLLPNNAAQRNLGAVQHGCLPLA